MFVLSVIRARMTYPTPVRRWLRPWGRRSNRRTPGLFQPRRCAMSATESKSVLVDREMLVESIGGRDA